MKAESENQSLYTHNGRCGVELLNQRSERWRDS